jgi:hypothetical protein
VIYYRVKEIQSKSFIVSRDPENALFYYQFTFIIENRQRPGVSCSQLHEIANVNS